MGEIILGAMALVIVLLGMRIFVGSDPRVMASSFRHVGVTILGLAAVGAIFTGKPFIGAFLAAMAWGLFSGGRLWPQRAAPPLPQDGSMTRDEALAILGLRPGASADEIRAAADLMAQRNHPANGGSDYLLAKINEAKLVLLRLSSV